MSKIWYYRYVYTLLAKTRLNRWQMLEQVLQEIKVAEKKAEEIRVIADSYALQKNKEAEALADQIKQQNEAEIKSLKARYKEDTNKKADVLYDGVLEKARVDADALYQTKQPQINKLADEIVGKVLNGDC